MEKLIVRLSGIRKSMRIRGIEDISEDSRPKKAKSSKERVKAYRHRLKTLRVATLTCVSVILPYEYLDTQLIYFLTSFRL